MGQFEYKQKAQKIPKFHQPQGRQKIKVFPQGNYIAQNSIPKTSTISLYYVTKGISEMHQLERELWLSEVLQSHQISVIHPFIFTHSLISENDKNVPSIIMK